eukprot:gb/GECH01014708.1/.p1 GENE.gb/GECH01014708.1/~~gb/GECH01014708.1/.p1  ORF type:complete len:602 (+),score=155.92 gb/GECH01014708.1/:1-1806(+)
MIPRLSFQTKSHNGYKFKPSSQFHSLAQLQLKKRGFTTTSQFNRSLESSQEVIHDSRFGQLKTNDGTNTQREKLSREEVMKQLEKDQRKNVPLSEPYEDQFAEKTFLNQKLGSNIITNQIADNTSPNTTRQNTEEMKITKLDNGLRVVTLDENNQVCGAGLYINSGTRYESVPTQDYKGELGATAMLERLAFKSSKNFSSTSEIIDSLQVMGANTYLTASREYMVYGGEVLSDQLEPFLNILSDTIFRPNFHDEDIEEQKYGIKMGLEEMQLNPESKLMDAIHYASFGNSSLGRPLVPEDPHVIDQIDRDSLHSFRRNTFAPQNSILIASGVEHDQMIDYAERYMSPFPGTKAVSDQTPKWQGLEYRLEFLDQPQHFLSQNLEALTHMAISFEGFNSQHPDYFALHVLRSLLGGGSSFSAGGPGKGVLTRLYTRGLNRHFWLQRVESSFMPLFDTGIFSIYGATHHNQADRLAPTMVSLLVTMAHEISDQELMRAKNQLKSHVLMTLETRQGLLDEMAIGLLAYDQPYTASDLCQFIDNVTRQDLERVAQQLVETRPGYVVIGDEKNTPSRDEVENMLKEMPQQMEQQRNSTNRFFNLFRK